VVNSYRRYLETLVRNFHYSLCKNPEDRSSHLLRGGSQKSHMFMNVLDEHSGSIFSGHQKVEVVGSD
jgi:hypothetical protein